MTYDEIERDVQEIARKRLAEPKPDFVPYGIWRRSREVAAAVLKKAGKAA